MSKTKSMRTSLFHLGEEIESSPSLLDAIKTNANRGQKSDWDPSFFLRDPVTLPRYIYIPTANRQMPRSQNTPQTKHPLSK